MKTERAFKMAYIKDLETQYLKEEITYSRYVELLNEKALEWSNVRIQSILQDVISDAFKIGVYRENFDKDAEWGNNAKKELLIAVLKTI